MTFILCCPVGTYAKLRPPPIPPRVISGDWMDSERSYNSWAGAVEFCVAQSSGAALADLCPYDTYCPDGPGSPPYKGRRQGGTGDDQWAPYGGDGDNRWVQTGIWGGDPGNTCMGHHQIAGGVHGNPGWGTGNQGVADAGYLDWVLCCGEGVGDPVWYDGDGNTPWDGTTWGAGIDFCTARQMELCPCKCSRSLCVFLGSLKEASAQTRSTALTAAAALRSAGPSQATSGLRWPTARTAGCRSGCGPAAPRTPASATTRSPTASTATRKRAISVLAFAVSPA